ncbi:hypothetical protein BJ742DRAFT_789605 [Cladochytrium replicatum]|nr:hypothetical protein BJ742DRAFT_789605 [Cladochytrium replicatum]
MPTRVNGEQVQQRAAPQAQQGAAANAEEPLVPVAPASERLFETVLMFSIASVLSLVTLSILGANVVELILRPQVTVLAGWLLLTIISYQFSPEAQSLFGYEIAWLMPYILLIPVVFSYYFTTFWKGGQPLIFENDPHEL